MAGYRARRSTVSISGAALGPLSIAALQAWSGSYALAMNAVIGLLLVCMAIAAFFAPRPAAPRGSLEQATL